MLGKTPAIVVGNAAGAALLVVGIAVGSELLLVAGLGCIITTIVAFECSLIKQAAKQDKEED